MHNKLRGQFQFMKHSDHNQEGLYTGKHTENFNIRKKTFNSKIKKFSVLAGFFINNT